MPNPYSGQRFIPASHVGQYQTMGGGQGGGLGTSWGGQPAYAGGMGGGGQMPQLGGGQPGGGGGAPGGGGPNWFPGSLGYDQSTGQPWGSMKSIGLNLGNFMQDQKPGWGMTQGGMDQTTGKPWGSLQSLGLNLGQPQMGGGILGPPLGAYQGPQGGGMGQGGGTNDFGWGMKPPQPLGGGMGQGQQPNYNPPPGYFNPSQQAFQQGNYTQPNFTMAGQGGGMGQQPATRPAWDEAGGGDLWREMNPGGFAYGDG